MIKTFRTKRDAADWARRTEDEMVRGVYIDRATSERMLLKKALARYIGGQTRDGEMKVGELNGRIAQ